MNAPLASTGVSSSTLGLLADIPGADVALDSLERGVLFLDTLRQRGNIYTEHVNDGAPALLKFAHEPVLDGRDLPRRCNYSLLHILPLAGVASDPQATPVVVVDPHGIPGTM